MKRARSVHNRPAGKKISEAPRVARPGARTGVQHPPTSSRRERRGLNAQHLLRLEEDVFDEDRCSQRTRRAFDADFEEDDDDVQPLEGDDEEVPSDGEDVELPWEHSAGRNVSKRQGLQKQRQRLPAVDPSADDEVASIGSSLDGAEMADLSHMLDDDVAPAAQANASMLHAVGLQRVARRPPPEVEKRF